jgi:hypothetical protein
LTVTIYQFVDGSEAWAVEYINPDDDGVCEKATFYGPRAERQAKEFAAREYGSISPLIRQPA